MDTKELWLCNDCAVYICNADLTGLDYHPATAAVREAQITTGAAHLGHVTADYDSESEGDGGMVMETPTECDCCKAGMVGNFTRFAAAL